MSHSDRENRVGRNKRIIIDFKVLRTVTAFGMVFWLVCDGILGLEIQ